MPRELIKLSQRAMVRRILAVFDRATAEEILTFGAWYDEASRECRDLAEVTGYPVEVCAAVVSALSPRNRWEQNKVDAWTLLLDDEAPGALGSSVAKARRMLAAHYAGKPLLPVWTEAKYSTGSHKTVSFWRNLCGDLDAVTIDTWAVRAALGPDVDGEAILKRRGAYDQIADAYRAVARSRSIPPATCQAIVWCLVRGSAD